MVLSRVVRQSSEELGREHHDRVVGRAVFHAPDDLDQNRFRIVEPVHGHVKLSQVAARQERADVSRAVLGQLHPVAFLGRAEVV